MVYVCTCGRFYLSAGVQWLLVDEYIERGWVEYFGAAVGCMRCGASLPEVRR